MSSGTSMSWLTRSCIRFGIALFGAIPLCILGLFSKRHWTVVCGIAGAFGYNPSAPEREDLKPIIPAVPIEDLLPGSQPFQLFHPSADDGQISSLELIVLNKLIARLDPKAAFEFGTFDGRTTLNIAANTGENCSIYTLDLPADDIGKAALPIECGEASYILKHESGELFRETDFAGRITQLYGDSAAFPYESYCKRIDFCFVDASHSYEYVMSDSLNALALLSPEGGSILWHDYDSWPGVTKALNTLYLKDKRFCNMKRIQGTSFVLLESMATAP